MLSLLGATLVLAAVGADHAWQAGGISAAEPAKATVSPGSSAAAGGAERTVAVSVVPITVRSVQRAVSAVGSFFGYDEVTVVAEVSGVVAKVHYDVGDLVQPGDVLLELDPTDYELAAEETRRALELEATRIGVKDEDIAACADLAPEDILTMVDQKIDVAALPLVSRARQQRDNALLRLKRVEELRQRGSISQEEYDQRRTDWEVATTTYDQADSDARAARAGIKHRLVLLKIALRKVSLTKVKVPTPTQRLRLPQDVKYAVVERKVTEGEMVKDAAGSSSATFKLVLDGALKLKASVPERYISQVQAGQKAEIRVDAFPNQVFVGEVIRINPLIERTSRTFEVEVFIENTQRQLKAGGFAKVDILARVDPEAWTVPAESVVSYAGSTKIFVVRNGRAHAIPIVSGLEGSGWVELERSKSPDLQQDDKVITSGQEKLAEGVIVVDRGKRKE
ncbi:MAG: efflux RND transporter periplasmic adaptor subunit [Planctomycetota bacterium]|nr:efflux RND transporter periplasmic adaptor subunit [Planctomycetota bacterium]